MSVCVCVCLFVSVCLWLFVNLLSPILTKDRHAYTLHLNPRTGTSSFLSIENIELAVLLKSLSVLVANGFNYMQQQ